jgi:REP element-mobilizing transposase RayT
MSGTYLVTICTRNREALLGQVEDGIMIMSPFGTIVQEEWRGLPTRFSHLQLDEFTVVPNHIHGIITLLAWSDPAPTLGTITGAFKSIADRRCRQHFTSAYPNSQFGRLWQRGFHDRVIDDVGELARTREYVRNNVVRWET